MRHLLERWVVNKKWTDDEMVIYTSRLQEPARAVASALLYRTFLLREFIPVVGGRYRSSRLSTSTLIMFGQRDPAISQRLLSGHEPYADDLEIELVPQGGHCIAEDQPELVTQRALEFFGE